MSPSRMQYRAEVSYSQAHLRLKTDRGRPNLLNCVSCKGPANEWAYMGGDPDELTNSRGMKYSLNQDLYEPMCIACHRRHDRALSDGRSIEVCANGHLWKENLGVRIKRVARTGLRFCKACNRENTRRYRLNTRNEQKPVTTNAFGRK